MAETSQQISEIAARKAYVLKEIYKRSPDRWLFECVKTVDEHDRLNPVKLFPDKPYIRVLVKLFETIPILLVPKSRQMLVSWLFSALCLHEAQFYGHQRVIIMARKQDDSFALIDRLRFMYAAQPKWLVDLCPLDRKMRDQPIGHLFLGNGSTIMGMPQGADQIRGYTPSRVFMDEAAFQEEFEASYMATLPAIANGGKLVAVSSAGAGFFQSICGENRDYDSGIS